jgi:type I restriction enzyme, S subunit
MSAKGNKRSADIPGLDSKSKRGLENPRSFARDGQGDEGNSVVARVMSDWQTCAVPDSFIKNKVGRQNQVPAKDIAEIGRFPIIDQGQKFIAGYCDDESKVIDFDLPLIIFGDHTRCFKYVDFPFVLGADGTKVLLPDKKLYDPRFYYFALLSLEIPSRGYNRHFTILNERTLPLPPLPEQKRIAHILSTVQRAIEAQERIIQTTTELKKALMHKLFTEGLRGEPQKQTEIGPVPESWEVVPLGKYARVLNGYAFKSADYVLDGVRLIRISNVSTGFLIDKDDKCLPASYLDERSAYALKAGDLILSLTRPIIKDGMKYCFIEEQHLPALLNQRVGRFEITDPRLRKDYLFQIIFSPYFIAPLKYMAEGSNQPNVSPTRLEAFQIPIPTDMAEQEQIAKLLTELNRKMELAKQKISQLQDLFRTLLHELMTAKTRVHELELSKGGHL